MPLDPILTNLQHDLGKFFSDRTDKVNLSYYPRYAKAKQDLDEQYKRFQQMAPQHLHDDLEELDNGYALAQILAGEAYYQQGIADCLHFLISSYAKTIEK
jgi:hypothetical protein